MNLQRQFSWVDNFLTFYLSTYTFDVHHYSGVGVEMLLHRVPKLNATYIGNSEMCCNECLRQTVSTGISWCFMWTPQNLMVCSGSATEQWSSSSLPSHGTQYDRGGQIFSENNYLPACPPAPWKEYPRRHPSIACLLLLLLSLHADNSATLIYVHQHHRRKTKRCSLTRRKYSLQQCGECGQNSLEQCGECGQLGGAIGWHGSADRHDGPWDV